MKKHIVLFFALLGFYLANAQSVFTDSTFNSLIRKPSGGWIAGDATYSIALPDDRTLFLMGDSFIGEVINENEIASEAKMIRNCALILDGDSLRAIYGGTFESPIDFIQTDSPDSTWYWPEHGIVEDTVLKIFLAKFTTDPNGTPGWNFVYVGHDIALFSFPEIQLIKITSLPLYDTNEVMYGDRILKDSIYTYIYGRKDDTTSGYKIPYPHIARTTGDISNSWEYFDGLNWSEKPESTRSINSFQVSQQYSVFKHKNKYVLITQDIWLSPNIFSFTSLSPVGPWENKTLLYSTPIVFENTFTYNAYAHPQFDKNNNLLLSYNTNGDFWDIFNNVEIYRPTFIRVPFGLIDDDFAVPNSTNNININLSSFEIFPNPAQQHISIHLLKIENNSAVFKIFNAHSEVEKIIDINNTNIKETIKTIDIGDIPTGVYYGVLITKDKCETKPFVKIE